jgi:hypothetical protein
MDLTKKWVIGLKTETTQGTVVALTATDMLLAESLEGPVPEAELLERDAKRTSLDTLAHVVGKRYFTVNFKTEVKTSGSAGTAYAPLSAALQACGFTEAISAGTNVVYAPTSAAASANFYGPGKSCTIKVYKGGLEHVLQGCVGSVKITGEAGKVVYYQFSFRGTYVEPATVASPTQTYLAALPPILESAVLTLHGTVVAVNKLEIDVANELAERASVNAAAGLVGFVITGRKPAGSLSAEAELVATFNYMNRLIAGTSGSLAFTVGTVAGQKTGFSLPATQISSFKYGDEKGILTAELGLRFNQSSGDDWLTITQT